MQSRFFASSAAAVTRLVSCALCMLCASSLVACSGDDTSAVDAGGTDAKVSDASAVDARPSADASPGADAAIDAGVEAAADASDATADASDAADAGDPCATDGGDAGYVTSTFDWNYAVSSTTRNGGKGQVITVRRCDSVRWHNTEGDPHTVESTTGAWPTTPDILLDQTSAPIQMKRAGVFPYVCGIHGSVMSGELTVK
jgi:plastocyanin